MVTGPAMRCFLAAALFGAAMPASKLLLADGSRSLTLAGLLYLGAALAVAPFAAPRGLAESRPGRGDLLRLAGAALTGGCIAPALLLLGLSLAPAGSVSLWLNLEMVATAVLARAFFNEHVSGLTWLGVAVVAVAGVLLATPSEVGLASSAALVAVAATCWGIDNNLTATIVRFSPPQVAFVKGAVAALWNLGLGLVREGPHASARLLLGGLAIGAFGYGLSLVLQIQGARRLGATRAQAVFSTAPFLGLVFAWPLAGEEIHGVQVLAAAIMAIGVACVLGGARPPHFLPKPKGQRLAPRPSALAS